jgi:hypothetical protein
MVGRRLSLITATATAAGLIITVADQLPQIKSIKRAGELVDAPEAGIGLLPRQQLPQDDTCWPKTRST